MREIGQALEQRAGGVGGRAPTTKTGVGRIPKSGMDSSHETMMETAMANPLTMLSVYLTTRLTTSPPMACKATTAHAQGPKPCSIPWRYTRSPLRQSTCKPASTEPQAARRVLSVMRGMRPAWVAAERSRVDPAGRRVWEGG